MKNKLTLVDVIAEARDLRTSLLNMRLMNVYDVDDKTFLLRFVEPGREKQLLLIESGVRIHTTRYARDKCVCSSWGGVVAVLLLPSRP